MITDNQVAFLYGEEVSSRFRNMGLEVTMIAIPAGEASKTMETALFVMKEMLALGADRTSVIIALGGGVIGDLAGFVASVYMRGIPYGVKNCVCFHMYSYYIFISRNRPAHPRSGF